MVGQWADGARAVPRQGSARGAEGFWWLQRVLLLTAPAPLNLPGHVPCFLYTHPLTQLCMSETVCLC